MSDWNKERNSIFKGIGAVWVSGVSASLAYGMVYKRHLPISQRLIHARIGAQALTVGALVSMAGIVGLSKRYDKKKEKEASVSA